MIARSRTCCDRRSGGSTRKDGPTATNSEIAKPRNRRGNRAFCSARRVSVSFARRTKTNASPIAPSRRFARTARSRRTRTDDERETDTSWPSRRASRPSTTPTTRIFSGAAMPRKTTRNGDSVAARAFASLARAARRARRRPRRRARIRDVAPPHVARARRSRRRYVTLNGSPLGAGVGAGTTSTRLYSWN